MCPVRNRLVLAPPAFAEASTGTAPSRQSLGDGVRDSAIRDTTNGVAADPQSGFRAARLHTDDNAHHAFCFLRSTARFSCK